MKVGETYVWHQGYPKSFDRIEYRLYDILSITLTHVYIRSRWSRTRRNVSIETFKSNYEKWELYLKPEYGGVKQ